MTRRGAPDLKAVYGVPELADMIGLSRFQMGRWLRNRGVPLERNGRTLLVPLTSFREAFPEVWESMVVRAQVASY